MLSGRVVNSLTRQPCTASVIRKLSSTLKTKDVFRPTDQFLSRHMGSQGTDKQAMLSFLGFNSLDELIDSTIPKSIRLPRDVQLDKPLSESQATAKLESIMSKNVVNKSFIGMGFYETITPNVIMRNVLENPGWYTAYTPYQAEIAQGRLTSLLNYQTMITDLTALSLSNASLLDEATACAEAMSMCLNLKGANGKKNKFFVDERVHPQNIAVVQTRGETLGLEVVVGNIEKDIDLSSNKYCGVLIQYPDTYGSVQDWTPFVRSVHESDALVVAATDLMASVMLTPVGEMGVDIAVGSAQRFGVPMGFGGPHAGFLATTEAYSRKMPGRIIGVSIDSRGKPALRMAMQTREQHIRRDKATSNICTAQALLANMASFYAIYHGPEGLKSIAHRIHNMTKLTAEVLTQHGFVVKNRNLFFDTLHVDVSHTNKTAHALSKQCADQGVNVRVIGKHEIGISFGESITEDDVISLLKGLDVIARKSESKKVFDNAVTSINANGFPAELARSTSFLTHPTFNTHKSETQMMRYLKYLENMDLSLNFSMISLGSCTMKLNAASEMKPITWSTVSNMHPFAPPSQTKGYREMIASLNEDLCKLTGFAAVSAQPNSGAQGEYAGLLCIRGYHRARGDTHRNICLIPVSAHGTNPASASMCGMKVVVVQSDANGNIDVDDLKAKAEQHKDSLGALMLTYPSTYGVFEEKVREVIDIVHQRGGLVYMDGANMNAQVGLTSPGVIGADVCHLNLHKTFCIPHGGGGPGVGSIAVAKHLAPYLPGHVMVDVDVNKEVVEDSEEPTGSIFKRNGAVSSSPFGSASILPISWMYIKMLGTLGLKESTGMAILNANYMAKRLETHYNVLFRGLNGQCAHEFILDLCPFKLYGLVEEDVAKRLQDYGFHSPTMSWPVVGTIMIEPTESEDKQELDRFCDALISIRNEIEDVVSGKIAVHDSPLKHAPHTMDMVTGESWTRVYSRETAAFPAPWVNPERKFWPTVGRIDNVYGDRHLICTCPPVSAYETVHA